MKTFLTDIGVEEAMAAFSGIRPVAPKRIPLFEATGLRLAEDVVVKRPVPMASIAARDGWAVRAAETVNASRRRTAALGAAAVMIDAGAPMPTGTDAVLAFGEVLQRPKGSRAIRSIAGAEGVATAASIARPGTVLAPAGTRVTLAVALACAGCGVTDVVVRRPIVDVIYNSSGVTRPRDNWTGLISGAIRASGSEIGSVQFTSGDRLLLSDALLASSADIVAVIGGTGEGPGDTTMQAIAQSGEVVFHGVRMSPGRTVGFGTVDGRPVFAMPAGIADMVAANIVMTWPFARQAFGRPPLDPPVMRAPLAAPLAGTRRESRLVFAVHDGFSIRPIDPEGLTPVALAQANACIFLPEAARHRRRGETVSFRRLGVSM